jgi:hypothetical protein
VNFLGCLLLCSMHFPQAPTQVIWLLFLKCRAELFQRGGESYNVFDVGVKHFFQKLSSPKKLLDRRPFTLSDWFPFCFQVVSGLSEVRILRTSESSVKHFFLPFSLPRKVNLFSPKWLISFPFSVPLCPEEGAHYTDPFSPVNSFFTLF